MAGQILCGWGAVGTVETYRLLQFNPPAAKAPHVLLQAQKIRTRLMRHYRRIFFEQGIDYVATPTTGTTAPVIR